MTLVRSTHHFCYKCHTNLSEYRQEECNNCKSSLIGNNCVLNSNDIARTMTRSPWNYLFFLWREYLKPLFY